ncbi:phage tail tape measure protein [Kitasatospora viridis]|nr:phage tail tape measure protein [Kitasatospora viridis]
MATPPPPNTPPALAALLASTQAQMAATRQMQQTLQALVHMQGTYGPTPGGPPASPAGGAMALVQALMGGRIPQAPLLPTVGWFQAQAQRFTSQVLLNQPQRGQAGASAAPQTPAAPAGPASTPWPGVGGHPMTVVGGMPWMMPGAQGQQGPYPYTPPPSPSSGGGGGGGGGGGVGGSWSGGSGIGQWVQQNAPSLLAARFGPWGAVAGAAIAVGSQIPAEIRSQRDKNAFYQSVEGGSNFAGFGERLHEEAYRWSTLGVFSSDEARQAFKGVTKLGYNSKVEGGPGRQDALNMIYHGKTAYGASVGESLQTLQVVSKAAVTNFKQLSDALKDVSDSAGKAGINAQMARAEFTNLVGTAASNGMGGNTAVDAARLQQQLKTSLGRSFQDTDFSNRLGSSYTLLASSVAGVTPSQYLASADVQASAQGKLDSLVTGNALKPGVQEWVEKEITNKLKVSGKKALSDAEVDDIASRLLTTWYPVAYDLVAALTLVLPKGAEQPLDAARWVVRQIAAKSQGGLAGAAKQELSDADKKHQAETSKKNKVVEGINRGGNDNYNPAIGQSTAVLPINLGNTAADEAYRKWAMDKITGGNMDPVVEALLGKVKDDGKTQVVVTTAGGKKRVVSLEDAVTNHRNELAQGDAVILDSNGRGQTVKDILGGDKIDPLRDFKAEANATDDSGQSLDDWKKQNAAPGGGVTIGLTQEAKRLLMLLDTSGTNGAAASATPPTNPNTTFPSMPATGG